MNKTLDRLLFVMMLLASVLLYFAVFSGINEYDTGVFFNTDALYLPSLYQDLLVNHNGLEEWNTPPSLLLIPDVLAYFSIRFLAGDFIIAGFAYGLFQYLIILLLFALIFKQLVPENFYRAATISGVLMAFFPMVSIYSKDFVFASYLFQNGFHAGAFVMALLCTWLGLKYSRKPSISLLVLLTILMAFALASDLLFLILCIIPLTAAFGIKFIRNRDVSSKRMLLSFGLASLVGYAVYKVVKNSGYLHLANASNTFNFENILSSFQMFSSQLEMYLQAMDFRTVIVVLTGLSFLIQLVMMFRLLRQRKETANRELYLFYSVVFVAVVMLVPLLTGSYSGFDTLRYIIFAFYLSLGNLGLLLFVLFFKRGRSARLQRITLVVALVLLLFAGSSNFSSQGLGRFFNYYPTLARKTDEVAAKHHLKKGIANVWKAKFISMFSREGVVIYPVFDNLRPYYHLMNEEDFYDEDAVFNFIITYDFDADLSLGEIFGAKGVLVDSSFMKITMLPDFRYDPESKKPVLVPAQE